eukprot:6798-Heterococcus_DN1.PRE.1
MKVDRELAGSLDVEHVTFINTPMLPYTPFRKSNASGWVSFDAASVKPASFTSSSLSLLQQGLVVVAVVA